MSALVLHPLVEQGGGDEGNGEYTPAEHGC